MYKSCVCLIYKSWYIYKHLDAPKSSSNVVIETSVRKDLIEIKLEPDDFQKSIVNISEQTETTSDISELSQDVYKSCKNKTGQIC